MNFRDRKTEQIRRLDEQKKINAQNATAQFTKKQAEIADQMRTDSKKTAKWTLGLAGASLIFSLVAVGLSVCDYFGDKTWQTEQITELKTASNQNEQIIKLLTEIKNKQDNMIINNGKE